MSNQDERYQKGIEVLSQMTDDEGIKKIKSLGDFYPDFEKMIVSFGYGDLYSRKALDLKQRELVTLSSLITQGAFDQLEFHIRAALNVGLKPVEIVEAIIHCAGYAGFPKACSAMVIAIEVLGEVPVEAVVGSARG